MNLSPTFQLALENEIKDAYLRGVADGERNATKRATPSDVPANTPHGCTHSSPLPSDDSDTSQSHEEGQDSEKRRYGVDREGYNLPPSVVKLVTEFCDRLRADAGWPEAFYEQGTLDTLFEDALTSFFQPGSSTSDPVSPRAEFPELRTPSDQLEAERRRQFSYGAQIVPCASPELDTVSDRPKEQ